MHHFGVADFTYQPVFSVFDYGTITPPVPLDNSTICLMAGFNFEILSDAGFYSHYINLVDHDGIEINAREAVRRGITPVTMRVRFANRVMPEFKEGAWDYTPFKEGITCYVLPVEFISRNGLPAESSVWKRLKKGEATLVDVGLPADFKLGDEIPAELRPLLDYSTKFEPEDRYLTAEKTIELSGFNATRFAALNAITKGASNLMTNYAASRGFKREDGKVEYVTGFLQTQKDMLGDAVCTWHEDRLTYEGFVVSKQLIRNQIKKVSADWVAEIERAKQQAKEEGKKDFRPLMNQNIPYISPRMIFFEAVNRVFQAATNVWVNEKVFSPFALSHCLI